MPGWERCAAMAGKTVLVTGGTSGIGLATALGVAALGADVIVTGRDPARTVSATGHVRVAGAATATGYVADMSSQSEVRRLAIDVLRTHPRIDVLINNAGGYWNTRHLTPDGLERTLAVNFLAPFLLTNLLLGRLLQGRSRVVTVSSKAETLGRIDFENLQGETDYSGARAYNQAKLATVLFTYELSRRLASTTVTANALHPGLVRTAFGAEDPGWIQRLTVPILRPLMATPARGARTTLKLAVDPAHERTSGQYFTPRGRRRSSPRSYDRILAARLWDVSTRLTGLLHTRAEDASLPADDDYVDRPGR